MNLRNISIRSRLNIVVALTLTIIITGSIAGLVGISRIGATVNTGAHATEHDVQISIVLKSTHDIEDLVLRDVVIDYSTAARAKIDEQTSAVSAALEKSVLLAHTPEEQTDTDKMKQAFNDYMVVVNQMVAAREKGDAGALPALTAQLETADNAVLNTAYDLQQREINDMQASDKEAMNLRSASWLIVIVMCFGTLFFALIVGYFITRSINQPLKRLGEIADKISGGDMAVHIDRSGNDEIGRMEEALGHMAKELKRRIIEEADAKHTLLEQVRELSGLAQQAAGGDLTVSAPEYDGELGDVARSFNLMTHGLRRLSNKMADVINHLSSASSEIEVTAQQQASGSNEQAASVSEVTAAVNELATNAKEVARAAESVSEAANESLEKARKGQDAVENVVVGMEEIQEVTSGNAQKIMALEEKSQEIGSILAIIDDIAAQTNLLALNAAIEAARAGDAGKGFAVVAQEIRNLAEDVTSSTKEIAGKIKEIQAAVNSSVMATEESQKRTEDESRVVREAGERLAQIGQLTEHTAELAMQISGAVQQQRTASEQVVQTMNEVSEVARQSALGSQESVRSAQDLANMAGELKEMISNFKLD